MIIDWTPVWLSLKTAFTASVVVFITGVAAARWIIKYQGRGKSILDSLFMIPLVLPPTVTGFLLLIFLGKNGPLGALYSSLGLSIIFTWPAAVIAATVVSFPIMYQTARGSFEQINPDIEKAARVLGASEWEIFLKITVPLAWPGLAAGLLLSFARSLGEFGATLMLAGNLPGRTQTLPIAIYFAAESGDLKTALVWVSIVLLISLYTMILLNYWKRRSSS